MPPPISAQLVLGVAGDLLTPDEERTHYLTKVGGAAWVPAGPLGDAVDWGCAARCGVCSKPLSLVLQPAPPACTYCGGPRVFELQVLAPLMAMVLDCAAGGWLTAASHSRFLKLTPDLIRYIADSPVLHLNDVATSLKLTCTTIAQCLRGHRLVLLTWQRTDVSWPQAPLADLPWPGHEFARHWGRPEPWRRLSRRQRQLLLCLAASSRHPPSVVLAWVRQQAEAGNQTVSNCHIATGAAEVFWGGWGYRPCGRLCGGALGPAAQQLLVAAAMSPTPDWAAKCEWLLRTWGPERLAGWAACQPGGLLLSDPHTGRLEWQRTTLELMAQAAVRSGCVGVLSALRARGGAASAAAMGAVTQHLLGADPADFGLLDCSTVNDWSAEWRFRGGPAPQMERPATHRNSPACMGDLSTGPQTAHIGYGPINQVASHIASFLARASGLERLILSLRIVAELASLLLHPAFRCCSLWQLLAVATWLQTEARNDPDDPLLILLRRPQDEVLLSGPAPGGIGANAPQAIRIALQQAGATPCAMCPDACFATKNAAQLRQSGGVASLTTFLAQIFPDSALKPVATTRQKSVYCLPADHKMKQFVLTTFQTITFADGVHVISYCTCNPTWRDKASVFECDTSPCTRAASLAALGHACPHARALQLLWTWQPTLRSMPLHPLTRLSDPDPPPKIQQTQFPGAPHPHLCSVWLVGSPLSGDAAVVYCQGGVHRCTACSASKRCLHVKQLTGADQGAAAERDDTEDAIDELASIIASYVDATTGKLQVRSVSQGSSPPRAISLPLTLPRLPWRTEGSGYLGSCQPLTRRVLCRSAVAGRGVCWGRRALRTELRSGAPSRVRGKPLWHYHFSAFRRKRWAAFIQRDRALHRVAKQLTGGRPKEEVVVGTATSPPPT
eukprot:XP_001701368.1 predicted protein [Chlamydomonas reinhardtii]